MDHHNLGNEHMQVHASISTASVEPHTTFQSAYCIHPIQTMHDVIRLSWPFARHWRDENVVCSLSMKSALPNQPASLTS